MFLFHSSCAHCAVDDSLEFGETAKPSFIGELGVSPVLGLDCRQFFSREGGGGGGGRTRYFPRAGFEAAAGRNRGYCKAGVPSAIYLFINEGTDSLLACLTGERNEHDNSVVASCLIDRSLSR